MSGYRELSKEALSTLLESLNEEYKRFVARGLKLNMTRGKPSPEQLDLSRDMLDVLSSKTEAAVLHERKADDLRNYGGLTGLPEACALMAAIMGVDPEDTIVCGNSSLTIMHDLIAHAMTNGIAGQTPWAQLDEPAEFLCPVPGYDRHFSVLEHFGIKMIPVSLSSDGPDMNTIERYVNTNPAVKGIWCVPKYSNPTGITYSHTTVRQFAALTPAARDFRIYWDYAYAVHTFKEPDDELLNIKTACEEAGNNNLWYMFSSTSKITFAGAGISAVASSPENIAMIKEYLFYQTIGPDKLNQLRHVLFLRDLEGVQAHMRKHAAIIRPKFEMVLRILDEELSDSSIGEWTHPHGGYFISFSGLPCTAKRIVQLAKDAGLTLTEAGATYPYKKDPYDSNIRIAPTYPSIDELASASTLLALCVKIASVEVLLRTEL